MFYNPAMAADRDLGVAFARARTVPTSAPRTGWEMTAATGVRGLRLLHEADVFGNFLFTEANPEAFGVLSENARRFPGAVAVGTDAHPVPPEAPFDYVDLDPYGSPASFVRTALSSVRPHGVVAVTATDMMVLAGAQPAACRRRYGARPVRGRLGPEGGLRILLAYLAREAASMNRSIRPLLAYARDHHVRVYAEVLEGSPDPPVGEVDPSSWEGPFLGEPGPFGPLWLGPLFDAETVTRLEVPTTAARPETVAQFLTRVKDEVAVDRPFYYEPNRLAARLRLAEPPSLRDIAQVLRSAGFRVARTHARPEAFRTDAPRAEVERLLRSRRA